MLIRVNISIITFEEKLQIINFYNSKKNKNNNEISILDRCELGFQIKLDKPIQRMFSQYDKNNYIKQLRLKNRELVSEYNDFTIDEKFLLYRSLCHVLGSNNIYISGLNEFDKKQLLVEIKDDNIIFNKAHYLYIN